MTECPKMLQVLNLPLINTREEAGPRGASEEFEYALKLLMRWVNPFTVLRSDRSLKVLCKSVLWCLN